MSPLRCATASLACALIVAAALSPFEARLAGQAQGKMDYLEPGALDVAMAWASASPHAQLVTIGSSIDYQTDPGHPALYPIKAIRIFETANSTATDDNRKNAILFECGTHPREWLTTESCWSFVLHLVNHAEDHATNVPELLANADVWIVPLTTVAGRVIDDRAGGNPEIFDRSVFGAGWRGNGDTRGGCAAGVNVGRNFSAGWLGEISTDCTDDPDGVNDDPLGDPNDSIGDYRGFAPFSSLESTTLRQFVENHSISMVVIVHSNFTQIWNLWGAADTGGSMIRSLAALAWQNSLGDARFALAQNAFGSGLGQFSEWLARPSNTPGESDLGTTRSIQTIFVELPFSQAGADDYTNSIYRWLPGDTSNGFHPSSNNVRSVIQASFLPMAEELVREARSPGCSTLGGCPDRDFGLVGAKIGRSSQNAGAIRSYPAGCLGQLVNGICESGLVGARDEITAGSYYVDYRVQNFSAVKGNDDVRVTVRVEGTRANGLALPTATTSTDFLDLAKREARTGRVAIDLGTLNAAYTVTIFLTPRFTSLDGFASNDTKIFKVKAR